MSLHTMPSDATSLDATSSHAWLSDAAASDATPVDAAALDAMPSDAELSTQPSGHRRHRRPSAFHRLWQLTSSGRLWRLSALSRHLRPLLLFCFVVLAGVALAVAVRTDSSGPATTQVIENSSDPFGVDGGEQPPGADSGTAFGVIEVTATPTADPSMESVEPTTPSGAGTSEVAPTMQASPAVTQPARREPAAGADQGSEQPQNRIRRPAPGPTAVPVPQETAPAPKPDASAPTPTPTPTDEGLLHGLFH